MRFILVKLIMFEGELGYMPIWDNDIDKLQHDTLQSLYDQGHFKPFDEIDWDFKFPDHGFGLILQMCKSGFFARSEDGKYYKCDDNYTVYELLESLKTATITIYTDDGREVTHNMQDIKCERCDDDELPF